MRQALRRLDQQVIAGGMAELVVYRLEVVQIDEAQGKAALVALRLKDGNPQTVGEQRSIGQVDQRIVVGPMPQFLFQLLAVCDIRQGSHETHGLAGVRM